MAVAMGVVFESSEGVEEMHWQEDIKRDSAGPLQKKATEDQSVSQRNVRYDMSLPSKVHVLNNLPGVVLLPFCGCFPRSLDSLEARREKQMPQWHTKLR